MKIVKTMLRNHDHVYYDLDSTCSCCDVYIFVNSSTCDPRLLDLFNTYRINMYCSIQHLLDVCPCHEYGGTMCLIIVCSCKYQEEYINTHGCIQMSRGRYIIILREIYKY